MPDHHSQLLAQQVAPAPIKVGPYVTWNELLIALLIIVAVVAAPIYVIVSLYRNRRRK
jgi:hypothetical protein